VLACFYLWGKGGRNMLSESAVRVCVRLWLEAGCKSIGGGIYYSFVAVNISRCLVCEGYRIGQFGSFHTTQPRVTDARDAQYNWLV
jgi:hypothetical protein